MSCQSQSLHRHPLSTPNATPTRGPFVAPRGACTVWTANGETMVAECKSPHLSPAGNAANAQLLALGASAVDHLRIALQQLADRGVDNEHARALVEKVDAIGRPAGAAGAAR